MTDQNVNSKIFLSILDEFDENGKTTLCFVIMLVGILVKNA